MPADNCCRTSSEAMRAGEAARAALQAAASGGIEPPAVPIILDDDRGWLPSRPLMLQCTKEKYILTQTKQLHILKLMLQCSIINKQHGYGGVKCRQR
jgi:hypothetical protein